MKKLALAMFTLGALAAPALACPGHDAESPKTADSPPVPQKTADTTKKPDPKPVAKTADDKKPVDAPKKSDRPDKVSQR